MANSSGALAGVIYYAREKYYQHILTEVLEILKKYGSEPILVYWKAYSLIMSGSLIEGMRELDAILDKNEVILSAAMLLAYAHKQCETVDKEAVQKLEDKVRKERTNCGEQALYNAGMFLWLNGRHDKAREYVDRMLKMSQTSREGLTLRGWVDLTSGRDTMIKNSIKYFEDALSGPDQPKISEALFGKSRFYLLRYNFSHSLDVCNQVVASYEGFVPALIEKMKAQLALQDWEQALETAQRCLSENKDCIEAHRMVILNTLAREGDCTEAASMIEDLTHLLDRFETRNHALYYEVSLSFARMAGESNLVLVQTRTLVQRALSILPTEALYITEYAYQLYLSGKVKDAEVEYQKALNTDESSISALAGLICCQIKQGRTEQAEQHLEFLSEVQSSIGKQANLICLKALIAQNRNKPSIEVLPILTETIEIHFNSIKGTPLSTKYFEQINPHFLLDIAKAIMVYAPVQPAVSQAQADPILKRAALVLDPMHKTMPGMVACLYQMAKIKFLSGEMKSAQAFLQHIINKDNNFMEAHLMMARFQLHQGNLKQCSASLELALSSNFEVQNYPIYHLIKAQCERRGGDVEAALASLKTSINFITTKSGKLSRQPFSNLLPSLDISEKATIYLELASVHYQLGNTHEATKVMQDAINAFTGTSEEFRLTIANSELAMSRGNVEEALSLLRSVEPDNPHYSKAKEKMADIYIKKRNDKKMFISCYEELAKKLPGTPTALMLGDAFMRIQEPDKALEIYEAALKQNARDGVLARRVGQTLIKTHSYNKAVIFYETALKSEGQEFLRRDLADLFLKLRKFSHAEKVIRVALDKKDEMMELPQMIEKVQFVLLLAKVHQTSRAIPKAIEVLNRGYELQSKVLTRVVIELADQEKAELRNAARICYDLAGLYHQNLDIDKAIRFYRDALKHWPEYSEARTALANLFLEQGKLDDCDQECIAMIRLDEDDDQASLMRADLLYYRGSSTFHEAVQQLQEVLGRKPAHFQALSRLVNLSRKCGELEEVKVYLERAEKDCEQSAYEPGLHYCKGLYMRYRHEINAALQCFNQARTDGEWGEKALFNMIEICLNPDNDIIAGETLKSSKSESTTNTSSREDSIGVTTAEKLLQEVTPKSAASEYKVQILQCYVLLGSHSKQNIESALEKFMAMASTRRNDVTLLLGIAIAHMLLKQVPRARNQLKIISKLQWTAQNAEDFEQAWLLLADLYIQSGKFDMAVDLLKKCIQYNRASSKAWECRGYIEEKEQAYKDAAECYKNAWQFSYHGDPAIGFKLAFNYMKAKWYVDAIDVCHEILNKHPNYPKIKKEILEKSRLSLRA